jgi:hypothetical protein
LGGACALHLESCRVAVGLDELPRYDVLTCVDHDLAGGDRPEMDVRCMTGG